MALRKESFSEASRGRNARYRAPPAQTRTCSFSASGSSVVLAVATSIVIRFDQLTKTVCVRFSTTLGQAIPNFSSATLNCPQLKLRRFPPRRLSHL